MTTPNKDIKEEAKVDLDKLLELAKENPPPKEFFEKNQQYPFEVVKKKNRFTKRLGAV